jgi:putative redox protein
MYKIEISLEQSPFGFIAKDADGIEIKMDNSLAHGGQNFGAKPMQMLLMALGGCSGIDVISILQKQKMSISNYQMIITGEREAGKEPSLWKTVHINFVFDATVNEAKANRAVELSLHKYCSVAETLRLAGATITHTVTINK